MEEINQITFQEIDKILSAIKKVAKEVYKYDMPLNCVNFHTNSHYYEFTNNGFLTRFHTKLMNCYNYTFNKEDTIDNPLSTHMKFIKEILDKLEEHNKILIVRHEEEEIEKKIQHDIQVENELKKQLKIKEDNKLRMEQQRMFEEEERTRLVMEQEKKKQEEKKKLEEYFLRQQAIKTEKIPCPNCGKMIARGNISTHKIALVCINFGKEIEVRKKGYFTCECGKEERNTNRQNHLATKKCMRKRGLIE
jgi:predicted RNA-binding Zn-ribbon protein involved in translation (DUF1610 family)